MDSENNRSIEHEKDEIFTLTPWGCLFAVLLEYGLDPEKIPSRVGQHMVEDFIELMITAGHLEDRREEREDG